MKLTHRFGCCLLAFLLVFSMAGFSALAAQL